MLIQINFESEIPIYMQLRKQLIIGIAKGELTPGETLPSVRQLAEDIGINLHTVNKTYNILKTEGYLTIDRRKGALVNEIPHSNDTTSKDKLKEDLDLILSQLYCKGVSKEDLSQWVNKTFETFTHREGD